MKELTSFSAFLNDNTLFEARRSPAAFFLCSLKELQRQPIKQKTSPNPNNKKLTKRSLSVPVPVYLISSGSKSPLIKHPSHWSVVAGSDD